MRTIMSNESRDQERHLLTKEDADRSIQDCHATLGRSYRIHRRAVTILGVLLTLACMALVTLIFLQRETSVESRTLSPVPSMPMEKVTFEQHERFAGPSTQENDEAWSLLMPAGDGFITIENPPKYNLPSGKQTPAGDVYDISLFHQLHCLAGIRKHLLLLSETLGSNNSQAIQDVLLDPQVPHIYHCFDYIRQGLMCAGDMTVEWPREEADGSRFAVDGWGVSHECKSWDTIMNFMRENDVVNNS